MNRLYVAESVMSLTGWNADHRVRLTSAQMDAYGAQVASAMEEINGEDPRRSEGFNPDEVKDQAPRAGD